MPSAASAASASSLDQRLVCQALAGHPFNEAIEARQRVVPDVSFVQPEGELVNVAAKVLGARVVIDADQAALENRENAFDAVRGHAVAGELASAVIDRIVIEQTTNARICAGF